jgi:hypothetical protein
MRESTSSIHKQCVVHTCGVTWRFGPLEMCNASNTEHRCCGALLNEAVPHYCGATSCSGHTWTAPCCGSELQEPHRHQDTHQ